MIIGHGRVTGEIAELIKLRRLPDAQRYHVIHTAPDELDSYRSERSRSSGPSAEIRTSEELRLCRTADRVFAVGPRLFDLCSRDLWNVSGAPEPELISPGFDVVGGRPRTPPGGRPQQVLMIGRLDDETIKGLDIAARGLSRAFRQLEAQENDLELLLRGVPEDQHHAMRNKFIEWAQGGPAVRVTPRSYTPREEELLLDLQRATLMLMPSRAEGFGLVGAEAIAAGTPTLISGPSGLGQLLNDLLPRDVRRRFVVGARSTEHEETEAWGTAVGWAVTPRIWTRRVATSITNRT